MRSEPRSLTGRGGRRSQRWTRTSVRVRRRKGVRGSRALPCRAQTTPQARGCGPRALFDRGPAGSARARLRMLMHAEREARRPKLVRCRQTPRDSSCSPEPPCGAPKRRSPDSVERAAAAQAGRASPRASDDSAGARATRVGCRSRSGTSSPVWCGGEAVVAGASPRSSTDPRIRGVACGGRSNVGRRRANLAHAKGCRSLERAS